MGRERYSMSRNSAYALLGLRYYVPKVGRFWTVDPERATPDPEGEVYPEGRYVS